MMKLQELLKNVSVCEVIGDLNVNVTGVNIDSRLVKEGNLFIAVKGTQADGHDYISKAYLSEVNTSNGEVTINLEAPNGFIIKY